MYGKICMLYMYIYIHAYVYVCQSISISTWIQIRVWVCVSLFTSLSAVGSMVLASFSISSLSSSCLSFCLSLCLSHFRSFFLSFFLACFIPFFLPPLAFCIYMYIHKCYPPCTYNFLPLQVNSTASLQETNFLGEK